MSIPDLEAKLRGLRIAEPPVGLGTRMMAEAAEGLRLKRRLRQAWGAAAAAAVLALVPSWMEPARQAVPMPEIPQELVALDPTLSQRARIWALADAADARRNLSHLNRAMPPFLEGERETP